MAEEVMQFAVDVGTSRVGAAVSWTVDGQTTIRGVPLGQQTEHASSAVFVASDGVLHGDAAERRGVGEPAALLRGYKRRIGDSVPLTARGRAFSPEELYARTVEWAVSVASSVEGRAPDGLVVTVPAGWSAHRRMLVQSALRDRGVLPATFVSEPVAAAEHYAAANPVDEGSILAVYDFGAGTFDAAFIRWGEPYTVIAAGGLTDLGGADFDDAVLTHALVHGCVGAPAAAGALGLAALRRDCVAAKEALSFDSEAVIPLLIHGRESSVRLVRNEFEAMIDADVLRTADEFERVRGVADVESDEITAILLSGGSSRIPRVAQVLSERYAAPLRVDADPKSVVALGAARWGARRAAESRLPTALALLPPAPPDLRIPRYPRGAVAAAALAAALFGAASVGSVLTAGAVESRPESLAAQVVVSAEEVSATDNRWRFVAPVEDEGGAMPAPEPVVDAPRTDPPVDAGSNATQPTPRATTKSDAAAPSSTPTRVTEDDRAAASSATPVAPAAAHPSPVPSPIPAPTPPSPAEPTPEPTTEPVPEPEPVPDPDPSTEPAPEPEPSLPPQEPTPDPTPEPDPTPIEPVIE